MACRWPQLVTAFNQILSIYRLETNFQWFRFHWLYGDAGNRQSELGLNKNELHAVAVCVQAPIHGTIFGRVRLKPEGTLTGSGVWLRIKIDQGFWIQNESGRLLLPGASRTPPKWANT